jgi:hypothetical protein
MGAGVQDMLCLVICFYFISVMDSFLSSYRIQANRIMNFCVAVVG